MYILELNGITLSAVQKKQVCNPLQGLMPLMEKTCCSVQVTSRTVTAEIFNSKLLILFDTISIYGFKLDGELLDKVMAKINKKEHIPTVAEEFIAEQEMKEEGVAR